MELTTIQLVLLALYALIYGLAEAVEEITGDFTQWKTSIFRKFTEALNRYYLSSFFKSAQESYTRKDHLNKVINFLKHTILVGFTDIWHFSDLVKNFILFFLTPVTLFGFKAMYITIPFYLLQTMSFHFNYHWTLRVDKKNILRKLFKFN